MDSSQMTCPKCGWAREPSAAECPACGIVYARYGGGPRRSSPAEADRFAPPQLPLSGEAVNPYAPPRSNLQNTLESPMGQMFAVAGVWRTGDLLVMQKGAKLPNRCLICNQPASVQLSKKLYWHAPWLYLLFLLNAIIYIIFALIARRKADVVLPLCTQHAQKRKKLTVNASLLAVAGLALMLGSCAIGEGNVFGIMVLAGFGLLIIAGVMGILVSNMIVPKRIDDSYVWLRKVSTSYLAALPPAPPGL